MLVFVFLIKPKGLLIAAKYLFSFLVYALVFPMLAYKNECIWVLRCCCLNLTLHNFNFQFIYLFVYKLRPISNVKHLNNNKYFLFDVLDVRRLTEALP